MSSRASICLAVSLLPSFPASGEVFAPIVIDIAGSSTVITGSGRGSSGSASVSPIVTSAIPATAMISPGPASIASTRSSASVTYSSATCAFWIAPVGAAPGDLLTLLDVPVPNPAEREATDVGRGVEVRHQRLQWVLGVIQRRRDPLQQQVQQAALRSRSSIACAGSYFSEATPAFALQ